MKITEITEGEAKETDEIKSTAERKSLIEIIEENKSIVEEKESKSEKHDDKPLTGVVEESNVVKDCTENQKIIDPKIDHHEKPKLELKKEEIKILKPLKKISIKEIKPEEIPKTEIPLRTDNENKEVAESDSVKEQDNSDKNNEDKDKASSNSEEIIPSGKL